MDAAGERPTQAKAFARRVRELRRRAGLTQEGLAELAGISRHTVSNLERAHYGTPRADTAALLADAFGLSGEERADFFALAHAHAHAHAAADPPPVAAAAPAAAAQALEVPQEPEPAGVTAPPAPAARLLGRGALLAATLARLADPEERLLTLLGPGGVGKTRLALEAARRLQAAGRPVAWAALESLDAPEQALPAIARAVGAVGQPQAGPVARIADAVADMGQGLLLVLDNCEHLLAAAPDIAAVLAAAPGLQVLATSRERLRIGVERTLTVPPLPVPDAAATDAEAAANPAVALFLDRAGLEDGEAALPDVRRVVAGLDGLPLAIELAAAQADGMSVAAIARLLERSAIEVLETGHRDVHARLRSMDGAVRWSYDLLEERDRRLLRVLSVFRGGADLELLEETYGRLGEPELARSLPRLVRASLASERAEGGRPRVRLLTPIRLFAEGELAAAGETEAVERAHRATMREFVGGSWEEIHGPHGPARLAAMDPERDNLTAALDRAIRAGDAADAMALAGGMAGWWPARGEVSEGARWLDRALALPGADAFPEEFSLAGRTVAIFDVFLRRPDDWKATAERMLDVATRTGHQPGIAIALTWLGDHAWYVDGDLVAARAMQERAVAILEPLGESLDLAQACERLGDILNSHGEPAAALAMAQRAVAIRRRHGDRILLTAPLDVAGYALQLLGRTGEARQVFLEVLSLAAELRLGVWVGSTLCRVGIIDTASPDPARKADAARLIGAAEAAAARQRVPMDQMLVPARDRALEDLAVALGQSRLDRLLAEGRALPEAEALALAGAEGGGRRA